MAHHPRPHFARHDSVNLSMTPNLANSFIDNMKSHRTLRRQFLAAVSAGLAGVVSPWSILAVDHENLIGSISKVILLRGRDGSGPTWFHPRACMVPGT